MSPSMQDHSHPGRRAPNTLGAVAGFVVILMVVSLPMNDVRAWVELTQVARWGYTDLLFAVGVLVAALLLLCVRVQARIPLYLISILSLVVIVSECYYVFSELNGSEPGEENYLSSIVVVLGFPAILICAVCGLFASLASRETHQPL